MASLDHVSGPAVNVLDCGHHAIALSPLVLRLPGPRTVSRVTELPSCRSAAGRALSLSELLVKHGGKWASTPTMAYVLEFKGKLN